MLGYLVLSGYFFCFSSKLRDTLECLIFRWFVKFHPSWTKLQKWRLGEEEWFVGKGASGAAAGRAGNPGRRPRRGTKQTHRLSALGVWHNEG